MRTTLSLDDDVAALLPQMRTDNKACGGEADTVKPAHWRCAIAAATVALVLCGCERASTGGAGQRWADVWLGALNSHSTDAIVAVMDPQATFADPTSQAPMAVALLPAFWSNMWNLFPDLTFSAAGVAAEGDRVAIEWRAAGTGRNGKPLRFAGVYVIEVRGNRVLHARAYYDGGVYLPFLAAKPSH